MTSDDFRGHNAKSVVVESYLCFVNSVITPLKSAIEADEAEGKQVLDTLENMKVLIAYLEEKLNLPVKGATEDINFESMATDTASQESSLSPFVAATSPPAHPWISSAKQFPSRQRSTAREIEILRTLEEAGGNGVSLKRLQHRLISLGLADQNALPAIVTQISRLKKAQFVGSEAQGLYSHTPGGAEKLKKLSRNYAVFFAPDEARAVIPQVPL